MNQESPETVATAPGKIILFGEHSVVYGRPALAVPVSQVEATCQIEAGVSGQGVEIIAQDLGRRLNLREGTLDEPLIAAVQQAFSAFGLATTPDLTLKVRSTIPMARGMGSGAAVSAAMVKALGEHLNRPLTPQAISDIVYEVEKIHHGTPSGIDNTVVAFAQPVFFQRERPIARLTVRRPLTFVIADTGIESPTHKVVGDLRARRAGDVERYEGYFDEMAVIARQARVVIEQGRLAAIGKCMVENHAILDTMGVSSPELNRLVEAALKAKALGAKLSGAGWGGNMIALVQPQQAEKVGQALRSAGASGIIITNLRHSN